MAIPEGLRRFWDAVKRFWHTDNPKTAIVRDIVVAGGIVLFLLGAIWLYSGQPLNQAPVVSVESGSMMHGPYLSGGERRTTFGDPAFGRVGTIDPGDIVFVKDVDGPEDIEAAFGSGRRSGYGGHGDVVVYQPDGNPARTRVIHRAMLFVRVTPEDCTPNVDCTFQIPAACGDRFVEFAGGDASVTKYCQGSRDPPRMSLKRDGLFLDIPSGWPCAAGPCSPFHSGFITKGDNNGNMDQLSEGQSRISKPVRLEWIIGKARGEIPWFGLIKLALYGNCASSGGSYSPSTDPTRGSNWHLIRGCAPWDIWLSLLLSLGVLVSIPMAIDFVGTQVKKRRGLRPRPPLSR